MNKAAIGIDFGGTTVKPGVVVDGKIIARLTPLRTHDYAGHDSLLAAIRQAIEELRKQHPEVAAIGAGLPGMVDSINGRVWQLSNVPGWEDVPLTALLEEWSGLPAAIDNDANAMAYAEWLFGAGHEGVNVVCVTLGTGVGGGLILDRRLYRGSRLGAGEIGQMTMDPNGPPGQYGNNGALEKYVGNVQIAERAQALYREAGVAKTHEECSPLGLEVAANAGDTIAHKVWEEVGLRHRDHPLRHRLALEPGPNCDRGRSRAGRRICFRPDPTCHRAADDEDFSRRPDDCAGKVRQRCRDDRERCAGTG